MSSRAIVAGHEVHRIIIDAADFDGTNDYMTKGGALSGVSDGKSGIFSAWVRFDASGPRAEALFQGVSSVGGGAAQGFHFQRSTLDRLLVVGVNAASDIILSLPTASQVSTGTWYHYLASWDLAAAVSHQYLNDVSDGTAVFLTNDTIDYTPSDFGIGAFADGTAKLDGGMADVWFYPGQYLDFSIVANRRKFISASKKPVWLGSDGSKPLGSQPPVYLHLDDAAAVAGWATNKGSGGNFTITGTLTTYANSPSD